MNKKDAYISKLETMDKWDEFLLSESGLPGPRGNLELAYAAADIISEETCLRYISYTADKAPTNTQEEFLSVCGTMGLGRLLKEGKKEHIDTLRRLASDTRWRTREGVAMALQIYGESHMEELLDIIDLWAEGGCLEQRAAAAALCEPKLLRSKGQAVQVLKLLDKITEAIIRNKQAKEEGFDVLKKGLGYCWSVAIAAAPEEGKVLFEAWLENEDKDIRWIIKENLKKNRLIKLDEAWVASCKQRISL